MIAIRLHHSLHDAMVRDVQSKLIVHKMLGGQGAAHLRDQSPEQHQQIVIRLTDDLEMVASRRAIPKFEGVESYSRSEQVGAKVKLVDIPRAIDETHRLELRMFESLETRCLGHHIIEALAAEASVSSFNRAVVDDLVARVVWRQPSQRICWLCVNSPVPFSLSIAEGYSVPIAGFVLTTSTANVIPM